MKDPHNDEEEYHFDDDAAAFDFGEHDETDALIVDDHEASATPLEENESSKVWENAKEKSKKVLPFKKIAMGVGILVLIIAGYYLMMPHGDVPLTTLPSVESGVTRGGAADQPLEETDDSLNSASTGAPAAKPATPAVASDNNTVVADQILFDDDASAHADLATQTPSKPATAMTTDLPVATTTPIASDQDDDKNAQIQKLKTQLSKLSAENNFSATQSKSMQESLDQLQDQVQTLNAQILKLQQQRAKPDPVVHEVKSPVITPMPEDKTEDKPAMYYIQAIIPGRAWIVDNDGHTMTVTEGDRISALNSTVRDIDPTNGVVTLDNGKQIEYGIVAQ